MVVVACFTLCLTHWFVLRWNENSLYQTSQIRADSLCSWLFGPNVISISLYVFSSHSYYLVSSFSQQAATRRTRRARQARRMSRKGRGRHQLQHVGGQRTPQGAGRGPSLPPTLPTTTPSQSRRNGQMMMRMMRRKRRYNKILPYC